MNGARRVQLSVRNFTRLPVTALTKIDGGRIQHIYAQVKTQANGIVFVHRPSKADQHLSKIGEDTRVASFIGIGQCRACDPAGESHVVEFAAHGK